MWALKIIKQHNSIGAALYHIVGILLPFIEKWFKASRPNDATVTFVLLATSCISGGNLITTG